MQFEYQPRDPQAFAAMLPSAHSRLRVQSVGEDMPLLHRLLREFGRISGIPAVVNTSFNGFHEPIVCSPRDAVRVFYGTGLDAAFIGNFLLCK
jgi:carbamoyltransferase